MPIRLFVPPEIAVITLRRAPAEAASASAPIVADSAPAMAGNSFR